MTKYDYLIEEASDFLDEPVIDLFEGVDFFMEGQIADTTILKDLCYKKINDVLATPAGDKKYRLIVNDFMEAHMDKLMTPGPLYLIPFSTAYQERFYTLFDLDPNDIKKATKQVVSATGVNSDFKLITQNPYFPMFYFIIRYYTLKKDEKGINTSLGMYCLSSYWSIFTKFFPNGVSEPVMKYTIDNLTDKFLIKKYGSIFRALLESAKRSYAFHEKRFSAGKDCDVTAFIQRIRNDQNSMIKKIANEYMINYRAGNAAAETNDMYDNDTPILDDIENSTTAVQMMVQKVTPQIITSGIDLTFVEAAAKINRVSISNTRSCLVQIISQKNIGVMSELIEHTLFMFLYDGNRKIKDIKSQYFLAWGSALFKKTNSKDPNLIRVKEILNNWVEETGLSKKIKVNGTRVAYEKAIYIYFIFSIQKYC